MAAVAAAVTNDKHFSFNDDGSVTPIKTRSEGSNEFTISLARATRPKSVVVAETAIAAKKGINCYCQSRPSNYLWRFLRTEWYRDASQSRKLAFAPRFELTGEIPLEKRAQVQTYLNFAAWARANKPDEGAHYVPAGTEYHGEKLPLACFIEASGKVRVISDEIVSETDHIKVVVSYEVKGDGGKLIEFSQMTPTLAHISKTPDGAEMLYQKKQMEEVVGRHLNVMRAKSALEAPGGAVALFYPATISADEFCSNLALSDSPKPSDLKQAVEKKGVLLTQRVMRDVVHGLIVASEKGVAPTVIDFNSVQIEFRIKNGKLSVRSGIDLAGAKTVEQVAELRGAIFSQVAKALGKDAVKAAFGELNVYYSETSSRFDGAAALAGRLKAEPSKDGSDAHKLVEKFQKMAYATMKHLAPHASTHALSNTMLSVTESTALFMLSGVFNPMIAQLSGGRDNKKSSELEKITQVAQAMRRAPTGLRDKAHLEKVSSDLEAKKA